MNIIFGTALVFMHRLTFIVAYENILCMSSCAVSSKVVDVRSVPLHVSCKMSESSEQSKRPVFSAQHFTFHLMQHLKHTVICCETGQFDMYVLICI